MKLYSCPADGRSLAPAVNTIGGNCGSALRTAFTEYAGCSGTDAFANVASTNDENGEARNTSQMACATIGPSLGLPPDTPYGLTPNTQDPSRIGIIYGATVANLDASGTFGNDRGRHSPLNRGTRIAQITDGTSNTIMVGEHPPSADLCFGWWFAAAGHDAAGTGEVAMGTLDYDVDSQQSTVTLPTDPNNDKIHNPFGSAANPFAAGASSPDQCPFGPYAFSPDTILNPCADFHFWSLHAGGGNFCFGDAAVKFLNYSVNPAVMSALGTRGGGEAAAVPGG